MLISKVKHNWSWLTVLGLYHLIILIIVWINFPETGHYLTGWDALHPEFNFLANWERSMHAVWQDNYGVGAMVGHGFASLLPHIGITWLMSFILPIWAIRPAFILLMYYLGGLGMLFLIKDLLFKFFTNHKKMKNWGGWIALTASFYYLFNLATIQQFYTPLEAFVVQFALFPWFLWSVERYLGSPNKRNLIIFGLINLLGSVQGFIPVLFVTFSLMFGVWLMMAGWHQRNKLFVKSSLWLVGVYLLINTYWLLPFGYYVLGNNGDFLHAYNNQVSTPEFVAKSVAYGRLSDLVFMKSFLLEGVQPGGKVFEPWISHIDSPTYILGGWLLFTLIILGWGYWLIQDKVKYGRAYTISGFLVFGFLASQVRPFSTIMGFLYSHSELFEQVFRTSFTKFGLLLAGFYSIFLAIGLAALLMWLRKLPKILSGGLVTMLVLLVVYIGSPVFRGHFFDDEIVTVIPKPYFEVMNFFNSSGEGRIAEFPIECSEGWFSRPWGYYGSGFMWYGIKQPYLSRTFDVWSGANEDFYFEAQYVLRQPNFEGLKDVLNKYSVRWVYVDENLIHCKNPDGFKYLDNFSTYLANDVEFNLVGEFKDQNLDQPLQVYEYYGNRDEAVTTPPTYTVVNQINENSVSDVNYQRYGDYVVDKDNYLLANVFENQVDIEDQEIRVDTRINKDGKLSIPSYQSTEKILPVKISLLPESKKNMYSVWVDFLGPRVSINDQIIVNPPLTNVGSIIVSDLDQLSFSTDNIPMKRAGKTDYVGKFFIGSKNNFIATQQGVSVVLWSSDIDGSLQEYLAKETEVQVYSGDMVTIRQSKIFDQSVFGNVMWGNTLPLPQSCTFDNLEKSLYEIDINAATLRLINENNKTCLRAPLSEAEPANGYVFKIATKHIEGIPLSYRLTSWRGVSFLENFVGVSDSDVVTTTLIAPPIFEKDKGYILEFKNSSFGQKKTVNDILSVEYWFIPYKYLSSMQVISNNVQNFGDLLKTDFEQKNSQSLKLIENNIDINNVNKLGSLVYRFGVSGDGLISLNQGFDEGWVGLVVPNNILSIQKYMLLRHVHVNGWANGWMIPNSNDLGIKTVYLFYWPQLLEWIGMGVLVTFGVWGVKQRLGKLTRRGEL